MIARYTLSTGTAATVTFGLLFVMQLMIATGRPSLDGSTPHRMIPYLRVDPPPPAPPEREPPDRPVEMRPPELPQITDPGTGGPVVAVAPPAPPEPPPRFMGTFGTTDGDALPIVKVLPVYPAAALTSSLEGHVIVEFTITRAGTVKDIVVIESSHRVFERSAVEAAAKFRYRPRVVNGEPVEVRGKQHLVSFALDPEDRR